MFKISKIFNNINGNKYFNNKNPAKNKKFFEEVKMKFQKMFAYSL